jgi:uncharacterized membrane protein YfcA
VRRCYRDPLPCPWSTWNWQRRNPLRARIFGANGTGVSDTATCPCFLEGKNGVLGPPGVIASLSLAPFRSRACLSFCIRMSWPELLVVLLIGLAGGLAGGLLGIGGSIVMIPLLTLTFGANQHLYQASAMIVNVLIAVSASVRHFRAGSVRMDHFRWMLPAAAVAIVIGVACGNLVPTDALKVLFGIFLLYTASAELLRVVQNHPEPGVDDSVSHTGRTLAIGGLTGLVAGLLGVGGGTVAVPLLRRAARLPLRQAIGTSSAVMTLSSVIGASVKNATLPTLQAPDHTALTISASLTLAALLAVPAIIGGQFGARLTYWLPIRYVRLAFVVLIGAAGLRMVGWLG